MRFELTKEQTRRIESARKCGDEHLVLLEYEGGFGVLRTVSTEELGNLRKMVGAARLKSVTAFLRESAQ